MTWDGYPKIVNWARFEILYRLRVTCQKGLNSSEKFHICYEAYRIQGLRPIERDRYAKKYFADGMTSIYILLKKL